MQKGTGKDLHCEEMLPTYESIGAAANANGIDRNRLRREVQKHRNDTTACFFDAVTGVLLMEFQQNSMNAFASGILPKS